MNSIALVTVTGLVALLPSCRGTASGQSTIRINDSTPAEEDLIRLQEWRVQRAMQEVVLRYGLEALDVDVIIEDEGGLGETRPEVDLILDVTGAKVSINRRLFLDNPPASDAALLGLFAHELAHALHYSRMDRSDLVIFAERYVRFFEDPTGSLRPWAEAYERLTDLTAIAYGYGDALAAQKLASKVNVAKHHPKKVWNFYITPEDIASLAHDQAALRSRLDLLLIVVDLPSLERLVGSFPIDLR